MPRSLFRSLVSPEAIQYHLKRIKSCAKIKRALSVHIFLVLFIDCHFYREKSDQRINYCE
ncbi:unnamed protein product [Moneuplotes crassus]|uniref:Uncharacterized protein n=1 Tax=Euplotes crassus TaxID=5936 RepID=A0AAD1UAC9_EUPCR|nr:unnamed protein product [Moneuplotes crassus]